MERARPEKSGKARLRAKEIIMKKISRRALTALFLLTGPAAYAATATPSAAPAPVTVAYVEDFLKEAGLQACRVEKLNPRVSTWHGTVASMWVEVAPDCTKSDQEDPDVIHVHQFDTSTNRDSMISRYRSSMPRGINISAGIWPVGDYGAVALIGPHAKKYRQQLQIVYEKRLGARQTGKK
jgi:hypothetical protein